MLRSVLAGAVIVVLTIAGLVVCAPGATAAGALSAISFVPSSTATGASGVSLSVSFVAGTAHSVSSFTVSVPTGMSLASGVSAPSVTASAWNGFAISLGTPTATLSTGTVTVSFGNAFLPAGAQVALTVGGLKNPTTAVTASSTVQTLSGTTVVDAGTSAAVSWTSATATNAFWSPSSTVTGATGVTERYGLTTPRTATISSVRLLLPPGSGGTPQLTSVSPAISGGTVSVSGQVLTYSFTAKSVPAGTSLALTVSGLTNPTVDGAYPSVLTTASAGTAVASATVPAVNFAAGALSALSWSPSSTTTGATGVSYTVGFTVTDAGQYSSFVLNLPPGTSGTPTLTSLTVDPSFDSPASSSVAMSGGQLVVSFPSTFLQASAVITLEVGGLTNTSTPGSYPMAIAAITGTRTLDAGVAPAVALTSTSLTSLSWAVDSTAVKATGVSSTVGFGVSSGATITAITMSVPPSTGGTPAVGAVTPTSLAGGSVTLSGQTLTYTLPAAKTVAAGTNISVQTTGLTNTPTAQTYAATVTVLNGATTISSGTTPAVTFTATALTALSWATTSTTAGASAAYTYGFTTSSATNLSSVTMSVPSGTTGTPTLGTVTFFSSSQGTQTLGSLKVSLAGTKLTMTFTALFVDRGTQVSIQVNGLTNTTAVGTYTSAITTNSNTGAVDSGTTPSVTLAAASLTNPAWTVSSTAIKQTGVAYTFTASPSAAVTVSGFRMSVPSDTGGTPTVGAVQPAAIAGGTVTLSGSTLTYTFPVKTLPSGSAISIEIDNLTNTAVAGSYVSTITATNDGAPVASGTAAALGFTSTVLASPTWSVSSSYAAATGVTYTFGFTTSSSQSLTGVQFALPTGTGGTPALGTVTAQAPSRAISLSGTSISLNGSVLSLAFASVNIPSGTTFSVQVGGLTNTAGPGSYTATIATRFGASSVDSGTTPVVNLVARYVTMAPPTSLAWVAPTLGGNGVTVVDTRPSDQGYSVVDATGTNAGWNVTVAATTFTDGLHTLPNAGTFSVNGSLNTPTSTTAPAATCITLCTTPVNRVSYPVSVSTAASAPPAVQIYSAAAGSGAGAFTIGGSTSSAPLGWWVHIPATAYAGTYTSTITFSISAGP